MKYLILLMLLVGCGTQTHKIEVDEIKGKPTFEFGPNFEAWYEYCVGQAQYRFDIGEITSNEIDITTRECYYNLDLDLPPLPDNIGEENDNK